MNMKKGTAERRSLETVEKLSVIANQSADWCGDPPDLRETCVF